MNYTLLQNGQIISENKVIEGDLLIGNSRILAIEETILHNSFEAEIIDLKGKFVLPGLIHYNCPFLTAGNTDSATTTSIYQALSHGATFILDTIVFNEQLDCIEQLSQTREGCKPIIPDFAFHLGMESSCEVSSYNMEYCFIHEGITSFYLPGNFQKIYSASRINRILQSNTQNHTIFIFDNATLKSSFHSNKEYLKELAKTINLFIDLNVTALFLDVATRDTLELLTPFLQPEISIYAALNISESGDSSNNFLGIEDLLKIKKNPNVMLLPPNLGTKSEPSFSYIEHGRNTSFLEKIYRQFGKHGDCLLPTLCELYATRPAKLLGVYPRKGILKAGSDADLIIWAPTSDKKKSTETEGTANTALLRKDIKKLFISGMVLEHNDSLIQKKMEGKFVYRGAPIQ